MSEDYEESTSSSLTSKAYVGGYYLRETTGGVTAEHYLHFDHLGSVEAISDAEGKFVTRMSFDAYGNRRNANWTALATPPSANAFATTRGFTGHDMVDAEAVVHMGGRVYDPAIGRFLSADLYVQAPDSSQSYNRYSYTFNNPLSLVDPTGYATTCTRGQSTQWVCRDDGTTLTGDDATWLLRDMEFFNSDWRQIAQIGGDWSQAFTETIFTEAFQPAFEGSIEVAFNIQTGNYAAAIGAGLMTGIEFAARKFKNAEKLAEEALEGAKEVKEGVYEFIDTAGKKYCGQSCNIPERLKQHINSGKLDANQEVTTTEVLGGRTAREIAEHKRIQEITGGVRARDSDIVSNKVDPIGSNRRHLLDD